MTKHGSDAVMQSVTTHKCSMYQNALRVSRRCLLFALQLLLSAALSPCLYALFQVEFCITSQSELCLWSWLQHKIRALHLC